MGSLILYISRGHTEATYSFVSQPTLHTCKGVSISQKPLEMQVIQIKVKRGKYKSLMYKITATTDMISNDFVSKGNNINTQ